MIFHLQGILLWIIDSISISVTFTIKYYAILNKIKKHNCTQIIHADDANFVHWR